MTGSNSRTRRERVTGWARGLGRPVIAFCTALLCLVVTLVVLTILPESDCGIPTELTILTSQEANDAVQSTLRDFERYEARDSSCYVVHLTAYPAANARLTGGQQGAGMRSVEAQFADLAGWLPKGLPNIGARPDVWISDSPYDVALAGKALSAAGGAEALPTLEQRGLIADSPLVIGLPSTLVNDSLTDLVQENDWTTLYSRLHGLGITLAMPDPASSDTGLFHLTGLDPSLAKDQGLEAVTRDLAPDSKSLLCSALQPAKDKHSARPANTAYLVSEAALVSYNEGKCGSRLEAQQELKPFYPSGTRPLRFTFTSVHWGGPKDQVRSRYAADFYSWLTGKDSGGSDLARVGRLRLSTRGPCDTTGATAYRAVQVDPTCRAEKDGPGPNGQAQQALAAFEAGRPPAHLLIGIDASTTMAPNLPPISTAVKQALSAGPVGGSDMLAIWRLPGPEEEPQATLIDFQPGIPKITSQLETLRAGGHSAVYDMLIDAGKKLRTLSAPTPAPIQAVVLLTDGDGYEREGKDPHGGTIGSVTTAFTPSAGSRPIKLYVIAFGSIGCQGPLGELARRNHGECQDATVPDLERQLKQVLSRLAKGK